MTQKKVIISWKTKKYYGDTICFKPVDLEDIHFIIKMRNQDRSKYYLNQVEDSNENDQIEWINQYLPKDDDIYWIYCDKDNNQKLGTIRLYDIANNECEIGSSTADLSIEDSFFSFMEAHSLAMKFAIEELNLEKLRAETRVDNKFVDMILRRLGFEFKEIIKIRNVDYKYYEFYVNERKV